MASSRIENEGRASSAVLSTIALLLLVAWLIGTSACRARRDRDPRIEPIPSRDAPAAVPTTPTFE